MARQKGDHLIYGIGHTSKVYPATLDGKKTKEYEAWRGMLKRCHDEQYLLKEPTYDRCVVSDEWLYYDNFYNWLIAQENYQKWKNGKGKWSIDKDIKHKGNKLYSKDTCFLVPQNVNNLFTNRKLHRGQYPIGVSYSKKNNKFLAYCSDPFKERDGSRRYVGHYLGSFITQEEAFYAYKTFKENIIKKVALLEFENGNITQRCYEAMLKYQIEIND